MGKKNSRPSNYKSNRFAISKILLFTHLLSICCVPEIMLGYKNELALIPTLKEFNRSVRTKRIHFRKQIFIKKRSAFGDFPSSEQKSQLTKK